MSEPVSSLQDEYARLLAVARGEWNGTRGGSGAPPGMRRVRDLHLLPLLGDLLLVIGCDSNASIGEKPNDKLPKAYSEVGISALKVTMMEVLASGATPVLIVNALCMEMEPSGRKLIEAMKGELVRCGFDPDLMLTGSTEDNVLTLQSGIGITVIGLADRERLRIGRTKPGDVVLCVGEPRGGVDLPYAEGDPTIASISTVQALAALDGVNEILPGGSKGMMYEAEQLAAYVGLQFRPLEELPPINLYGSAGAATAVLVTIEPEHAEAVQKAVTVPVFSLGTIEEQESR